MQTLKLFRASYMDTDASIANNNSLEDIWSDDAIGDRAKHAAFLQDHLIGQTTRSNRNVGYVLNIDASWGMGKTFFLERFRRQLEQSHKVAFINAWRDDYADDPLMPLLNGLQASLEGESSIIAPQAETAIRKGARVLGAISQGVIKQTLKRYIGSEAIDIVADVIGNDDSNLNSELDAQNDSECDTFSSTPQADIAQAGINAGVDALFEIGNRQLTDFQTAQKLVEDFTKSLTSLTESISASESLSGPLFIIVDELDRCRPTYAIALLERVKHLFAAKGVCFVFATDLEQLSHSIKAVYGTEFDSSKYLRRFFDQTYHLETLYGKKFIKSQLDANDLKNSKFTHLLEFEAETIIEDFRVYFDISQRDLKRIISIVDAATKTTLITQPVILPYILLLSISVVLNNKDATSALLGGTASLNNHHPKTNINRKSMYNESFNFIDLAHNIHKIDGMTISHIESTFPGNVDRSFEHRAISSVCNQFNLRSSTFHNEATPKFIYERFLISAGNLIS
jgi:hypothetical protein